LTSVIVPSGFIAGNGCWPMPARYRFALSNQPRCVVFVIDEVSTSWPPVRVLACALGGAELGPLILLKTSAWVRSVSA
jgi:hypothetical protein